MYTFRCSVAAWMLWKLPVTSQHILLLSDITAQKTQAQSNFHEELAAYSIPWSQRVFFMFLFSWFSPHERGAKRREFLAALSCGEKSRKSFWTTIPVVLPWMKPLLNTFNTLPYEPSRNCKAVICVWLTIDLYVYTLRPHHVARLAFCRIINNFVLCVCVCVCVCLTLCPTASLVCWICGIVECRPPQGTSL